MVYTCLYQIYQYSRAGITEMNNMMQPHGGGRMEEKHNMCDMHVCGSIAMHSTEMNCQE